jgi:glucose dehydrogenase
MMNGFDSMVELMESLASDSFYGGDRSVDNLFRGSLVALDAPSGHLVWYFQTVRHDAQGQVNWPSSSRR